MLGELAIAGGFVTAGLAAGYYATYAVRSQWLGKTVWRGNEDTRAVALTFDDGPSEDTAAILDVLKEYRIKASFFMLGSRVEKFPELARRVAREGHDIGNHSSSHSIFLYQTAKKTKYELQRSQQIIRTATGVTPRIARPPCGVRSPAYFAAARGLGLTTVQWTVAGMDWKPLSPSEIAENVLRSLQPGSIILLHDGDHRLKDRRTATVAALPLIIEGIWAKNLWIDPLQSVIAEEQNGSRIREF
jgi:peptidoglycan/xylan/chitin deacetylase (PgdA/CDA1 family)